MRDYRIPVFVGLLGGIIAIGAGFIVGDTYGPPGSADYTLYESYNRAMAILILMQAMALFGFDLRYRISLEKMERTAVLLAFFGWLGMAAGTAAEFWLFSDLPYGQANLRNTAFSFFSASSWLADLALLALGLRILIGKQLPWTFAVAMIMYLPLDIGLFIAGQSIFLATALTSTTLALLTLHKTTIKTGGGFLGS